MTGTATSEGPLHQFGHYFEDAGIPKPVQARIERLVQAIRTVVTDEFVDCFVSEYVNEDATRTFESVWLFTESGLLEGDFRSEDDDFDYVVIRNSVVHVVAYRRSFDMEQPSDASRLTLDLTFTHQIEGSMKASGQNCFWLAKLLGNRILPNMRTES